MTPSLHTTRTASLIERLNYQTAPGVHTHSIGECGHSTRGGRDWCSACIDAELLRRFVDVVRGGSRIAYERVGGELKRKGTQ